MPQCVCVCRSEDNLWDLDLFFHHVGSGTLKFRLSWEVRGILPSGAGVIGSCKASKVDAGNHTQVFCKSGGYSKPLVTLPWLSEGMERRHVCMCLCFGMCMRGQVPAEAELELQVLGIKTPSSGRTVCTLHC